MSQTEQVEQVDELPVEVRDAYVELLEAFARFMGAVSGANELGIDVSAALGQSLRGSMSAEELDGVPVYLRMALGL